MSLTANFGNNTIEGIIDGINYNEWIGTEGITVGNSRSIDDHQIELSARIGSTFSGQARIIRNPDVPDPSNPIRTSSGRWGGQFSSKTVNAPYEYWTRPDYEERPEHEVTHSGSVNLPVAIGGTVGTKGTFQDGTTVTLTGAYEAFGSTYETTCENSNIICTGTLGETFENLER